MSIWQLENDSPIYSMISRLIESNHRHLSQAKILVYCCDKDKLKSNSIVLADASKASVKMKASMNVDFTITIYTNAWGSLTPEQKIACIDHELCHCSVHFEPVTEMIPSPSGRGRGKKKVVKDEFGRVQYTNEIKTDEDGQPKWKLIGHDLEEFRDIVRRHGIWDENIRSFKDALDNLETNN